MENANISLGQITIEDCIDLYAQGIRTVFGDGDIKEIAFEKEVVR